MTPNCWSAGRSWTQNWNQQAQIHDHVSGQARSCTARVVINAPGPFADELNTAMGLKTKHRVVFSQGIHLIVPRVTTTRHDRVLTFFDDTGRLFYVIPMGERSVIGTTDTRTDSPHTPLTDIDRDFVLAQINDRLKLARPLQASDVISFRNGVRPLVIPRDDGQHEQADWTSLAQTCDRNGRQAIGGHDLWWQAHRLPERGARGGRTGPSAGRHFETR